ncbi:phosphate ABC transporter permease subunit PstC [Tannerella sp. oral taxon 808]|nr:phosphate ABC transporter permease subunit PstC [Tannerella sp. oral taxon 808]
MSTSNPNSRPSRIRSSRARSRRQKIREAVIEFGLMCCGLLSIVITIAIVTVVLIGTVDFFQDHEYDQLAAEAETHGEKPPRERVSVSYFFTGNEWTPRFSNARYGILPLIAGTLVVAVVAALVALPIGLITAIYLSESATPRVRRFAKPTLEVLAGIPTVVYGYFALTTITPFLAWFIPGLSTPQNQLGGGIVVGIMIIPLVASLSEDAIRAVPRSLREASYALGANSFETATRVVVPAAFSGIMASFVLAISRAIGETMIVTLACGGQPRLTLDPREGIATMTSAIVNIAQGDVVHGSTDFNSLFAVAAVLFFMTFMMNVFAQWMLGRYRQVYQ